MFFFMFLVLFFCFILKIDKVINFISEDISFEREIVVLVKNIPEQLFDNERKASRSPELMWAIKSINARFGRYTVVSASASGSSAWGARSKSRSSAFTTCWKELPVVHA